TSTTGRSSQRTIAHSSIQHCHFQLFCPKDAAPGLWPSSFGVKARCVLVADNHAHPPPSSPKLFTTKPADSTKARNARRFGMNQLNGSPVSSPFVKYDRGSSWNFLPDLIIRRRVLLSIIRS